MMTQKTKNTLYYENLMHGTLDVGGTILDSKKMSNEDAIKAITLLREGEVNKASLFIIESEYGVQSYKQRTTE